MTKKNWGILLIALPVPMLIATIIIYAIVSFIAVSVGGSPIIYSMIRLIVNIAGMVAILGIIVGIPVGIYLLATSVRARVEVEPKPISVEGQHADPNEIEEEPDEPRKVTQFSPVQNPRQGMRSEPEPAPEEPKDQISQPPTPNA